MAQTIGEDLHRREEALNKTLETPGLVNRMFAGTLSVEEVNMLADAPFYIYAFEQDINEGNILIFWNSNVVVGVCDQNALQKEDYTLFRNNGIYLKRCIRLANMENFQSLVVLYPIASSYPLQNEYLRSAFAAADYIPSSTKVSENKISNSLPVTDKDGHSLFYVQFRKQDLPKWIADRTMMIGLLTSLFFSITWIHLIAIAIARKRSSYTGLAIIATVAALIITCLYTIGLPFHLNELAIFSTQLYAASAVFPSLGILLVDMFLVLWIIIFLLSYFNEPKPLRSKHGLMRWVAYTIALISCTVIPAYILESLVIDSRIFFDVSNFYAIDIYTLIGLLAVGLISGNAAALIYWINKRYNALTKAKGLKYLVVVAAASLLFLIPGEKTVTLSSCVWLIVFLIFLCPAPSVSLLR